MTSESIQTLNNSTEDNFIRMIKALPVKSPFLDMSLSLLQIERLLLEHEMCEDLLLCFKYIRESIVSLRSSASSQDFEKV